MAKKIILIISSLIFALPVFAAEKAAEVTAAKGRVEIVHGDAVMGKKAKTGAELIFKDILRTKRRGYAEVGFIDGTNVKVFEKSRLTINGLERVKDGYNAEIQKGKVLFKVEKMGDIAGDFRVKTTNSIIGVKGTTFGVVSGGLVTIVEVYNGNVEVIATVDRKTGNVLGQAIARIEESTGRGGDAESNTQALVTTLTSGQGAILSSSGDVQVYEFSGDGGESLIFEGSGDVVGDDKDDSGGTAENEGDKDESEESNIDKLLFGLIGQDEAEGSSGDAGDVDGTGDYETGEGISEIAKLLSEAIDEINSGEDDPTGDKEEPSIVLDEIIENLSDALEDATEFYSNPDIRPDTEEQINLATGQVQINITFE